MLLWRLAPAELYNGMDTPPECPPGLQFAALDVRVLFLQRDVGGDVDGGIAGCAVMVPGRELQGVNVQIVQHGGDGDLRMEFLKHQHALSVIGIKADTIPAAVIRDAADILRTVLCKNAVCLAGAAVSVEIVHPDGAVLFHVSFRLDGVPQLIDILELEGETGLAADDFGVGHTLLHAAHEGVHGGGIFLCRRGDLTELKESVLHRSFGFLRVGPLAGFGDIVPVFHRSPKGFLDMCRWESVLDGTEPDGRMRKKIDMRMIGAGFSDLVCQTEIGWTKQVQLLDDRVMVKAAVFRIVDDQRPFTALRVCTHGVLFLSLLPLPCCPTVILTVGQLGGAGAAAGDTFLEGNCLFPSAAPLPPGCGSSILPDGRNAGGLRGELNMALGLVGVHFEAAELNFDIAFRLLDELLAIDADTDLVQTVFRQSDGIAITRQVIRALTVLVLVCRGNIHQQLLRPERRRVNAEITNVQHG